MFNEFKERYLGKTVDVDGAFGGQCVDLFNAWNRDYNGCYINCAPTGYARSLAENKENNGILNYYKETTINNMIEGTVVVYGACPFAPVGHVGFFIEDNGNGTFKCLQQNYNNQQVVTINNNPYNGIIGAFIPNQVQEEFNRKLEEQKKEEEIKSDIKYLNLNANIDTWRVYAMDVVPVKGNECSFIKPSKFGGLSYTILGYTMENVAIIETRDFGQVQIYIGHDTTGKYSITDAPIYQLVN